MRFSVLLASCIWLSCSIANAQTTISGRVLDAKSGDALSGATILQTGANNGTSSDVEGNFTLTVPASLDSVALIFSSIGYLTQWRYVAPGSTGTIQLLPDTNIIDCGVMHYPLIMLGLSSGVRYTPFGARLLLDGHRLLRLPITAEVDYQTNFNRNYVLMASLGLPPLWQHRFTVLETIDYQKLQAIVANTRFHSYTTTVSMGGFRTIGPLPWVSLLVGGGYSQYQSLASNEAASISGFGYSIGIQNYYYTHPFELAARVQATRWPGYWQWQAQVLHPFGQNFRAGIAFNHLQHYTELVVSCSHIFY